MEKDSRMNDPQRMERKENFMQKTIEGGMFDSTSVVETVDGFPRGDKAVDAAFFARMMRCFYRDGILRPDTGAFAVIPGTDGVSIQVKAGTAWIGGRMAYLDAAETFALTAGKTYAVTLRSDLDLRVFSIVAEEDSGTAPLRTQTVTELLLAKVCVPAGETAVTAAMITDKRTDETVCGAVDSVMAALQSVAYAANSGAVGGLTADKLVPKSGCAMTGVLRCGNESAGASAVRNIRYGKTLPDDLADGEIFLLLADDE